jgi:sortase A
MTGKVGPRRRRRAFRSLEMVLWALGVLLVGCYLAVYVERSVYQARQEQLFDRELASRPAPSRGASAPATSVPAGALLGRIEIPAAHLHAMVVHGTADEYLRRAVGHIEGTALPGQPGNIGLAGHRDTFFRGLEHIHKGDTIVLRTLEGKYEYAVESLGVVGPQDTEVLNASSTPMLTLVTCYPFKYVGSAPLRFIVRAREVSGPPATSPPVPGS